MDGQERQAEQKAQEPAVQKETTARQEPERAEGTERTQERSGQAAEKGDVQAEFDRMIRGEYREAFERRAGALLAERMQGLRQENQQLRRHSQRQRIEAAEHLLHLRDSEERMREKYPGFCWQREMADPAFGRLVLAGVEPEAAYAAVHRQELLEAAMR